VQVKAQGDPTTPTVTAANAAWNGGIPANGSVTFGFIARWTGTNGLPASFTLNDSVCLVPVGASSARRPSRDAAQDQEVTSRLPKRAQAALRKIAM
jgi:hypothetical protein